MFGKYNGFVSRARVSACMYFLVYNLLIPRIEKLINDRGRDVMVRRALAGITVE